MTAPGRSRPGMAFAGFAPATALLGAIAFVTHQDYLGWRAPEYAQVFTGVTVGALVLGFVTIVVLATLIGIGLRESFS